MNIPLSGNNDVIDDISSYYQNHSSVKAIKEKHAGKKFNISPPTEEDIEDIIKKLDVKKATGIDNASAKLIKMSKDVIKRPLTEAIKSSISRQNKADHRPVTVLAVF